MNGSFRGHARGFPASSRPGESSRDGRPTRTETVFVVSVLRVTRYDLDIEARVLGGYLTITLKGYDGTARVDNS
jgi:hypothetical protein